MERLFSPCTRLHDLLESRGRLERVRRRHPEPLQELNLDVSTEELLSAERGVTFADLYAMLGNEDTIVWLTQDTSIVRAGGRAALCLNHVRDCYRLCFDADGKEIEAAARSPEHLLEICDVVARLLAASVVHSVFLQKWSSPFELIITPTLAYLMENCESLKFLYLINLKMDENHCRVLGAYSRPDLEIVLDGCRVTGAGASALAEVLGRNQGPTKLDWCYTIDNSVLANGLRGNSRLKSWKPRISRSPEDGNQELLAVAGALRENKGLVDLCLLHDFRMSDETWDAVCDSLKAHPTLEVLVLHSVAIALAAAVLKSRIQALLDMMKVNVSIRTLRLDRSLTNTDVYQESVVPYLETNRFRPRVRAIQKTRPFPYRANVLGRALFAVRADANKMWMLLSENAEIAFPSTTATTTTTTRLVD
jgi:hypothetical protein